MRPNRSRRALVWFWALIPIVAATVAVTLFPPYDNSPPVRSDGLGCYAWTQAIVQGNFNFCQWPSLVTVQAISAHNPKHPDRCENKYSPGLALLRFPVMGPLAATQDSAVQPDLPVSNAEEKASLWLGALALVITAGLVLATLRTLDVRPAVANVVALAGCFGTGLFHYATYDSSFTHIYSAALFAGLIFAGVSAAEHGASPRWPVTFVLTLFIALMREPDIPLLFALLIGWILWRCRPLPGPERTRASLRVAVPVAGAVLAVAVFQIPYNRWSRRYWTLSSHGQQQSSLAVFNQARAPVSYARGLTVWYPTLAVPLVTTLLARRARPRAMIALVALAILTVIHRFWNPWHLGRGLGHGGFLDIVPLSTVARAAGVNALGPCLRPVVVSLLGICSVATFELIAAYWNGSIPFSRTTSDRYWQHVVGSRSLLTAHLA